jgi:hypothetical protein
MKSRTRAFLEMWLVKNVPLDRVEPDSLHDEVQADVVACLRSASIAGISKADIDQECDLVRLIWAFRSGACGH